MTRDDAQRAAAALAVRIYRATTEHTESVVFDASATREAREIGRALDPNPRDEKDGLGDIFDRLFERKSA